MKWPFRTLYRGHVAPNCEYANSADSPHLMSRKEIQSLANEHRVPFILCYTCYGCYGSSP